MKKILLISFVFSLSIVACKNEKHTINKDKSAAVEKTPPTAVNTSPSSATTSPVKLEPQGKYTHTVKIETSFGIIKVALYDETPKHRDAFLKNVEEGFYNDLLFHRVIKGFMIQGGDPMSRNAAAGQQLGMGSKNNPPQRIPYEFKPNLIHRKGALAAARDNNPEKASSDCQFYIVQGKQMSDAELDQVQLQNQMKYTPEQRSALKTVGGTPFLDNAYTVFGEVIEGMEIIDKIAAVQTAPGDRPITDVKMKMSKEK